MILQESGEMYLETIYVLTKNSKNVRSIDVVEYMGFSKPSVSRAIGLLKSGGDMKFVFKVESLAVFGAVIPAALLAARLGAPPWVIFAALKCDQPLKCIPAAIRVNRFKWIKNIAVRN